MVSLENLVVGLGRFRKGPLQFSFRRGELYFVEGENGAGKSTLMKTMMGRLAPISGKITGNRFPMGVVGVEPFLIGSWSVRDNLDWQFCLSGQEVDKRQLEPIQHLMDLEVSKLSSGLKRQVELSCVLSQKFELLLLDEPFNFLDRKQTEAYQNRIKEAAKSGTCIAMTIHDRNDIVLQPSAVLELS